VGVSVLEGAVGNEKRRAAASCSAGEPIIRFNKSSGTKRALTAGLQPLIWGKAFRRGYIRARGSGKCMVPKLLEGKAITLPYQGSSPLRDSWSLQGIRSGKVLHHYRDIQLLEGGKNFSGPTASFSGEAELRSLSITGAVAQNCIFEIFNQKMGPWVWK